MPLTTAWPSTSAEIFWGEEFRMRVGASVYQGQPLFYLPDIGHPIVNVSLNESIASRVRIGMPAEVRIETFPDRTYRGRVETIDQVPSIDWNAGIDVQHRMATVRIENPPSGGLLPGMSAEVKIVTEHHDGALVVPLAALSVEGGRQFCYVAGTAGLPDRRPVAVDHADRDRLRIVSGLTEGERIVLDPTRFRKERPGNLHGLPRPSTTESATSTAGRSPTSTELWRRRLDPERSRAWK